MNSIRYLNLFDRVARTRCKSCFIYNNTIIFAVPNSEISKAVGLNGKNVKQLSEILGKKIKIIPLPRDERDIVRFVSFITKPIEFKKIEINNGEAIITAGTENKAILIGRKRARLDELQEILHQYFNVSNLKII